MRRSELQQKVIRRIRKFELTEEELDDLIHAGDLVYYGLNEDVVDDFCAYSDEKPMRSGSAEPRYLAGKVPFSRWLRLVKKEIRPDSWNIWTRYDGNVSLREINTEDADFMMRLVSDRKVTRFLPGLIQDREILISWIQSLRPTDHEYIITIEETGEEIGECSLMKQEDSAEIGFMLLPKYWLQGYGTEVVTSLIEIARDMRLKELTATTDARNKAAIRLLEKCASKKQKRGWMVTIPEDEESKSGGGQSIIQFQRSL